MQVRRSVRPGRYRLVLRTTAGRRGLAPPAPPLACNAVRWLAGPSPARGYRGCRVHPRRRCLPPRTESSGSRYGATSARVVPARADARPRLAGALRIGIPRARVRPLARTALRLDHRPGSRRQLRDRLVDSRSTRPRRAPRRRRSPRTSSASRRTSAGTSPFRTSSARPTSGRSRASTSSRSRRTHPRTPAPRRPWRSGSARRFTRSPASCCSNRRATISASRAGSCRRAGTAARPSSRSPAYESRETSPRRSCRSTPTGAHESCAVWSRRIQAPGRRRAGRPRAARGVELAPSRRGPHEPDAAPTPSGLPSAAATA